MKYTPFFAFLLALVCAMAALAPAVAEPTGTIVCNYIHPDCLSNHYLLVWVAEQLASGQTLLHNDRYYWPMGDAPWLAGNGSEGFLYLPFHLIWGWPLGSNLYLVMILTLNGLAGYRLARALGASPVASLAAAPTGALLLYPIHELGAGRFSQASACWLGFFLAEWVLFVREGGEASLKRAVRAGILLFITSFFYWYHGLFGVMAGAIWALVHFTRDNLWEKLVRLGIFSVSYLVLILPLLWVFLSYWSSIPGTSEDVFPHPEAVGDSSWPTLPFLVAGGRHAGRALPVTTCILALVGLWGLSRRERWSAVLVVGFFLALMAGPLIPSGPYELVYGLVGPLRRFWWPYRHVVVVNYVLVGLAGVGASVLLERVRRSPVQGVLGLVLALSIPLQLELQRAPWHAQFSSARLPHSFYAKLQRVHGDILVEVPLSPQVASAQTLLIYQLMHRKTLFVGHALWVDRVRPDGWDEGVVANSFLSQLRDLERGKLSGRLIFKEEDLLALMERGVSLYTVNEEYFPVALSGLVRAYKRVFNELFGEPVLTGVRVSAWDATQFVSRGGGVVVVEFPVFVWPKGLVPGGPTLALQAPRPPSPVFSVPGR